MNISLVLLFSVYQLASALISLFTSLHSHTSALTRAHHTGRHKRLPLCDCHSWLPSLMQEGRNQRLSSVSRGIVNHLISCSLHHFRAQGGFLSISEHPPLAMGWLSLLKYGLQPYMAVFSVYLPMIAPFSKPLGNWTEIQNKKVKKFNTCCLIKSTVLQIYIHLQ